MWSTGAGGRGRVVEMMVDMVVEMMDVVMVEEVVVVGSPFSILCSKLGIFDLYASA